ncbi:MAG: chemotaxis protein CheC [Hormoscilla sp.]
MLLTEKQKKGLTKFIKLVLSRRTAASISELIKSPVVLEVEGVSLHPLSRLTTEFADILHNEVTTVHQMFAGSMSGDALLMLDYEVAVMLTNLLRQNNDILIFRQSKIPGNSGPRSQLDISACEVLTEVGNILLNAYLGMLSNLFGGKVSFAMPSFQIELLHELLDSLILSKNEVRYVLVVDTTFQLCDNSVNSQILLVSSVMSLSCLIKAIEPWSEMGVPSLKRTPAAKLAYI